MAPSMLKGNFCLAWFSKIRYEGSVTVVYQERLAQHRRCCKALGLGCGLIFLGAPALSPK